MVSAQLEGLFDVVVCAARLMWGLLRPFADFAFSPDYPHCAIVSEDGMLRLVDFQDER